MGESYVEHLTMPGRFGLTLVGAGLACLVHAVFPFLFETTASRTVSRLHAVMSRRIRR